MNEFECGYLLGLLNKIVQNPEITKTVMEDLSNLKLDIIRFMEDSKHARRR